jgi:predicted acetyltransferase
MLKLLEPSPSHRAPFSSMAQDWREHGNDRYGLALDDFDVYLAKVEAYRHADQAPPGRVPGTELWLDDGHGEIVACVRLRFQLTPALAIEGGHIGYDVRPSFRRRGFGTAALQLALPEARRRGLLRALLTVDADNLPSVRIIERNGGVLSGETVSARTGKVIRQYWVVTAP